MADISKITLPTGTTYNIKDAQARADIAALSNYTAYLGVTTTALTDGATTNPVTINGSSVTATTGNIVTYQSGEFIWNGTAWQEFGDLSGLGSLAYKNSASGSFTPSGSVSQPTFSGTAMTSTGNFTPSGNITIGTGTGTANYTPSGSVSQPTFSGSNMTLTGNFTPDGSVDINAIETPQGQTADIIIPEWVLNVDGTTGQSVNYTPSGSVSAPTISVATAGSTTTIKNPTSKTVVTDMSTSAPAAATATGELGYIASVTNETLTFNKIIETNGASITTSNVTVKNGDASYSASQPTFTGTNKPFAIQTGDNSVEITLEGSFVGTQGSVSVSGTPSGTVSKPTFTGTGVQLTGSFSGTQGSVSVSGTPSGTVSQPSFTGTSGTVTVS